MMEACISTVSPPELEATPPVRLTVCDTPDVYESFESEFVSLVDTFGSRVDFSKEVSKCFIYRRLDSLARLLELDGNCTAVGLCNGRICIGLNQSKDEKPDVLQRRYTVIEEVMEYFSKVALLAKQLSQSQKLDLTCQKDLNRTEILKKLFSVGRFRKRGSESGIKSVFFNDEDYIKVIELMLSGEIFDLHKCSKFYDENFASIGLPTVTVLCKRLYNDFIRLEEDIIDFNKITSSTITEKEKLLLPLSENQYVILKEQVGIDSHAETQVILHFLTEEEKLIQSSEVQLSSSFNSYFIGISKLCCLKCHAHIKIINNIRQISGRKGFFLCKGWHDKSPDENSSKDKEGTSDNSQIIPVPTSTSSSMFLAPPSTPPKTRGKPNNKPKAKESHQDDSSMPSKAKGILSDSQLETISKIYAGTMAQLTETTINKDIKIVDTATTVSEYIKKFVKAITHYATKTQANYYADRSPISPDSTELVDNTLFDTFCRMLGEWNDSLYNMGGFILAIQQPINKTQMEQRSNFLQCLCSMSSFKTLFLSLDDICSELSANEGVITDTFLQKTDDSGEEEARDEEDVRQSKSDVIVWACNQFLSELKYMEQQHEIEIANFNDMVMSIFEIPLFNSLPKKNSIIITLRKLLERGEHDKNFSPTTSSCSISPVPTSCSSQQTSSTNYRRFTPGLMFTAATPDNSPSVRPKQLQFDPQEVDYDTEIEKLQQQIAQLRIAKLRMLQQNTSSEI